MARTSKYATNATQSSIVKTWRTAFYLRLSREDGDKLESESISSQKLILEDFAARRDDMQIVDVYIDDGYSGTNFERPFFQKMMEDIRTLKIDCVVVKDLSRFGRNYVEAGKFLETVFPLLKVRFISVNDNVDSFENPSSMNSVMIPFKNVMNDEYCRDISIKVRSSLTAKRRQGQFIGSFAAYGYCKDPANHNKLLVDGEAAEVVKLIYRLFIEGTSIIGIAKYLNVSKVLSITDYKKSKGLNYRPSGKTVTSGLWSDFTIRRILTNRVYIGDMVQKKTEIVSYKVHVCRGVAQEKWIAVEGTHQPIISKEDFDKVQSLLARDTRSSPKTNELGLFAGFIKCADCKRAMQKKNISQPCKYYYYVCSTFRKMSKTECSKHTVRSDKLENAVLTVIKKYVEIAIDMQSLINQINNSPSKNIFSNRIVKALEIKEKEKEKASRILLDLYPDYKNGLITKGQYLEFKSLYDNQLLDIESAIEKLNIEREKVKSGVDERNDFIVNFKKHGNITSLTRDILIELVNNIFIHEGGAIEIDFKFKDAYQQAAEYVEGNKDLIAKLDNAVSSIEKQANVSEIA